MAKKSKHSSRLSKTRAALGPVAVLLGVVGGFHAVDALAGPGLWRVIQTGTARVTAWILSLMGPAVRARGVEIRGDSLTFEIIPECTGVYPAVIFCAAILACRVSLTAKLWGCAAGIVALSLLNQVRLVSLWYVWHWFPDQFEQIHMVVWQSLMILAAAVLWLLWAGRVLPRERLR